MTALIRGQSYKTRPFKLDFSQGYEHLINHMCAINKHWRLIIG